MNQGYDDIIPWVERRFKLHYHSMYGGNHLVFETIDRVQKLFDISSGVRRFVRCYFNRDVVAVIRPPGSETGFIDNED